MKKILKEYNEIFISFIKNKKYFFTVILVAILSYGFTITHYTIGVDDLCFDRYVQGTYILSAKRWGTWLLYNLLNITEFSPFWLDFIVMVLMVVVATIICTFIKKIMKDKLNIWAYIIFSAVFISNPIIFRFFMYQSTNLSVVISNGIVIIMAIILFENFFNLKNKLYYFLIGLTLIIPLSMYESSAQTYVLVIFILCLLKEITDNINIKEVIKIIGLGILTIGIGSLGYYLTGELLLAILDKMNILRENFAEQEILWLNKSFWEMNLLEKLNLIDERIPSVLLNDAKHYLPVTVFAVTSIIALGMEIKQTIKTKKYLRLVLLSGVIFSNFILIIMQGDIKYRTQYSWIVTTAFLCMYIFVNIRKNTSIKYIAIMMLILLIVNQTRSLNQQFYAEYKKYEKEKMVAIEIARDVGKCDDWENKRILYITTKKNPNYYVANSDNGAPVLMWGIGAFREYGKEATKFINYFGFNLTAASNKDYEKVFNDDEKLEKWANEKNLIELEEYIIVNLDKYLYV